MGKKAVLKFMIYTFYAISGIITILLLCLPAWDNLVKKNGYETESKVGVLIEDKNGELLFGFMPNPSSNESIIYQMAVYTVLYLLIVALINIAVIAFISLDSNKIAKWLHVILCCAHATGLVFIFLIYSIRYLIEWVAPLRNYFLDMFGILVDFILILLLIMYKRKKNIDDDIAEIKVEGGDDISKINSKKSTIKKNNSKNPQLISEGLATPLYYGGVENVEHQPTVKPAPVDETKIVVSDNIVGNETYMDGNGNQFQYNTTQPVEVATSYAQPANNVSQSPVFTPVNTNIINNQSPEFNAAPVNNNISNKPYHKLVSEYTFAESNPYPVASDTVYNKIPEIPVLGKKDETK